MLDTWINLYGITNILYTPKIEIDGHHIMYDINIEWVVHTT